MKKTDEGGRRKAKVSDPQISQRDADSKERASSLRKSAQSADAISEEGLFERVVAILEEARDNVVRSVNTNMVLAYRLIGREIVQELQGGEDRAEYGKQVVEGLSARLTQKYGRGFSSQTLWNYRLFYQEYADRFPILSPLGRESTEVGKLFPMGRESGANDILHPTGGELVSLSASDATQSFSPQLSWSHYRALMRVSDGEAREFYEREAAECGKQSRFRSQNGHCAEGG